MLSIYQCKNIFYKNGVAWKMMKSHVDKLMCLTHLSEKVIDGC